MNISLYSKIFMKIMMLILLLLLGHLQYRLWFGDGSISEITQYQTRLNELKIQVEDKKHRNDRLYAEVLDLRKGQEAVEERAREELGMIRAGETFVQVIE